MHRRPRLTLALITAAVLTAALALLYTAVAWTYHADPRPKRDLLTELNAPWAGVPESERAAPVYQALHDAWQALPPPSHPDPHFQLTNLKPSDPAFPAFAQAVAALEPHLTAAREASGRAVLGADFLRQDPADEQTTFAPFDEVMAGSALHARIPGLAAASVAARLLLIDADAAAAASDAARTASDLHAALGIARQLREMPVLIADHVAVSIINAASDRLGRSLGGNPALFNADTLAALQADLTRTADQSSVRLDVDRLAITDVLDRTFTPGPSGRITAVGIQRLDRLGSNNHVRARVPDEASAFAPLRSRAIGDRAEHLAAYDAYLAAVTQAQAAGFPGLADLRNREAELLYANAHLERRLPVVAMLAPAYTSILHNELSTRLETAATITALALHRHRADHATFPESLDALVPTYLDAIPADPFDLTGGAIKYRLAPDADAFTLYSNGSNFRDDNATAMPPDPQRRWGSINYFSTDSNGTPIPDTHDADWILYPPTD